MSIQTPLLYRLADLARAALFIVAPDSEKRPIAAMETMQESDDKGYALNEPLFVLRGRDPLMGDTVRHWVAKGYNVGVPGDKLVGALDIADAADDFLGKRLPGARARDAEREAVRELLQAIDEIPTATACRRGWSAPSPRCVRSWESRRRARRAWKGKGHGTRLPGINEPGRDDPSRRRIGRHAADRRGGRRFHPRHGRYAQRGHGHPAYTGAARSPAPYPRSPLRGVTHENQHARRRASGRHVLEEPKRHDDFDHGQGIRATWPAGACKAHGREGLALGGLGPSDQAIEGGAMNGRVKKIKIRHFHLFGGLGGGARGFNDANPRVGNLVAEFECIGSIDVDAAACRDFERLVGVRPTLLDLFDRSQYRAFHRTDPPQGWKEAAPADIRRAAGNKRPHIVFLSAPCKGFTGLLSEHLSHSEKYQALNRLTLRGVWLMLEAWADDPPELILFENVPRIAQRGRHLLDQIGELLRQYGYAIAETTHDCGELGGLAQSRKRFLLVARHQAKVPPFLYEPPKRPLQAVGSVLGRMLMPGDGRAGPMHRLPALQWKTWVRLAFVEAGSDWRSLNKLAVEEGYLRDFAIAPDADYHAGAYGVQGWNEHASTVTSRAGPSNGTFAVADPRIDGHERSVQHGVRRWDEPAGVVTGKMFVGGGPNAVADPRIEGSPRFNNAFRIVRWSDVSPAVAGPGGAGGGLAVADPRTGRDCYSGYGVAKWNRHSRTVAGESTPSNGCFAVADPRPVALASGGKNHRYHETGAHYGVVPWDTNSRAVAGFAGCDNGPWSMADPRLPAPGDRCAVVIRAQDGTWHRPFTTFELAGLQSLVEPEEQLELDGLSDSAWRERIGNAVPRKAAHAIAEVMGQTLLLARAGETFALSATPIWVRQVAVALSVKQP